MRSTGSWRRVGWWVALVGGIAGCGPKGGADGAKALAAQAGEPVEMVLDWAPGEVWREASRRAQTSVRGEREERTVWTATADVEVREPAIGELARLAWQEVDRAVVRYVDGAEVPNHAMLDAVQGLWQGVEVGFSYLSGPQGGMRRLDASQVYEPLARRIQALDYGLHERPPGMTDAEVRILRAARPDALFSEVLRPYEYLVFPWIRQPWALGEVYEASFTMRNPLSPEPVGHTFRYGWREVVDCPAPGPPTRCLRGTVEIVPDEDAMLGAIEAVLAHTGMTAEGREAFVEEMDASAVRFVKTVEYHAERRTFRPVRLVTGQVARLKMGEEVVFEEASTVTRTFSWGRDDDRQAGPGAGR